MTFIETTLGEVALNIQTGPFGSQLHQSDYSDEGTPVVMPKDLVNGKVCENSIARVSSEHVSRVLDLLDYKFVYDDDTAVNILVPQKQEALAVAEIVDGKLSYSVLEYNHHSLRGNLPKKKAILKLMADEIEPQRKILNGINKTLSDNLFQMLQKFVRHNNESNPFIKGLALKELEKCYDDIYQMWLLAKLEIDNLERKKRVETVLQQINT